MSVRHLDHVNLTVANFDETVDWYGRVLDFELVEEGVMDGERWGVIRSGDAMLCIYERPNFVYKNRFAMGRKKLHSVRHFGLRYSDRAAWEDRMVREHVKVPKNSIVQNPHSKSWYVKDPTGYEVEVACWDEDAISFEGSEAGLSRRGTEQI